MAVCRPNPPHSGAGSAGRAGAKSVSTRQAPAARGPIYCLTDVDLARDNGPGVNERGFVSLVTRLYGDKVWCFAPRPADRGGRLCPGVRYVASHRGFHPFFYPLSQLHLLFTLLTAARRSPPGAIALRLGVFPLVPLLVSAYLGVPMLVKTLAIGVMATLPNRYGPLGRLVLYPLAFRLYRHILARARVVDVACEALARWATETFGAPRDRLAIIPNAVDGQTFAPLPKARAREITELPAGAPIVGFIGSLRCTYHGVDRLIKAVPAIVASRPDVLFAIVGSGREAPGLEDAVNRLGLQERFRLVGHVPHEAVPTYISAFDVATLLWPAERMHQTGGSAMKLRQYLACGCPVVASRGDGHEFIEDMGLGWLVSPDEPGQIADAIAMALALDPQARQRIRQEARRYALQHFSAPTLVRRRVQLWLEVLANDT